MRYQYAPRCLYLVVERHARKIVNADMQPSIEAPRAGRRVAAPCSVAASFYAAYTAELPPAGLGLRRTPHASVAPRPPRAWRCARSH
eukprot:185657-Pleurochrysis_carterae.AAC.3